MAARPAAGATSPGGSWPSRGCAIRMTSGEPRASGSAASAPAPGQRAEPHAPLDLVRGLRRWPCGLRHRRREHCDGRHESSRDDSRARDTGPVAVSWPETCAVRPAVPRDPARSPLGCSASRQRCVASLDPLAAASFGLASALAWGAGGPRRRPPESARLRPRHRSRQPGSSGWPSRPSSPSPRRNRGPGRPTSDGRSSRALPAWSASAASIADWPSDGWAPSRRSRPCCAAALPVLTGVLLEGLPSPFVLTGIGLAIVAVVLVSRVVGRGGERSPGAWARADGGVALGTFNITIAHLTAGLVFGPLTIVRGSRPCSWSSSSSRPARPGASPTKSCPWSCSSACSTCRATPSSSSPARLASWPTAAALSSLYPVTTVILAATFLRERITVVHAVGIVAAAAANRPHHDGSTV